MPSEYDTIALDLATVDLRRTVKLLEAHEGQRYFPEVWRALTDALMRYEAGAPERVISLVAKRLAELPPEVKAALKCP